VVYVTSWRQDLAKQERDVCGGEQLLLAHALSAVGEKWNLLTGVMDIMTVGMMVST